jgi:precorrin-6B methylase 2
MNQLILSLLLLVNIVIILGLLRYLWRVLVHREAPYINSRPHMVKFVLATLELEPGSRFCELGAGGSIITAGLAKKFPHSQFVALEKNTVAYLVSKWRLAKLPNAQIIKADIFKYDLSDFDYFYTYLLPQEMDKVNQILLKNAKPKARLYSAVFPITQKHPIKTLFSHKNPLFIYRY